MSKSRNGIIAMLAAVGLLIGGAACSQQDTTATTPDIEPSAEPARISSKPASPAVTGEAEINPAVAECLAGGDVINPDGVCVPDVRIR